MRWSLAAAVALALLGVGCAPREEPGPPELGLRPVSFDELGGWPADDLAGGLAAFTRSCTKVRPTEPVFGARESWARLCIEARAVAAKDARRFFEERFVPMLVTDRGNSEGLFTGYYEPVLDGARLPDGVHHWPIYRRPPELVAVDLGQFAPDLAGRRIAGRVEDGRLMPFEDRAEIDDGALAGRGLELLWVADPVARFFMEIQGSGRVRLTDGRTVRVGYDGQNGHAYRAIGKDLVERGALSRDKVSLQTIRAWLAANPREAPGLMQRNRSYVFFRELTDLATAPGPPGAMGVPLTPGRSLAVDRKWLPLGLPLWLETTVPHLDGPRPLRRLVVAQDTGGAITGIVRGDLFWGAGADAEYSAGHMRQPGRYVVLIPREAAPTS